MGDDDTRGRVETAVDALGLGPEQFYKQDFGSYLAMRALTHRLDNRRDDPGAKSSQNFMWDFALALEEGDLADAAEELRRVQDAAERRAGARGAGRGNPRADG